MPPDVFPPPACGARRQGNATFQARSTIDLAALLGGFGLGGTVGDFTFQTPPLIEASGSASLGAGEKKIDVIGKVALDRFSYRTVAFEGLTSDFAWDQKRLMLRDLHLRHRTGPDQRRSSRCA